MPETSLRSAAAALAPATVLRLLSDVCDPAKGEPPVLSVYLTGGQVLEGMLVRTGVDAGSDVVVLADWAANRLRYALVADVVAVEVRNPARFQEVLTVGRLSLPPAGEPVTRLRLQQEFAPADDFPVRVDWVMLDGSDVMLGNVAILLRGLREAAERLRADDMGQRAWERVRALTVEHHGGSDLAVLPVPGGLSVRADLSAALPRTVAAELYTKISALL